MVILINEVITQVIIVPINDRIAKAIKNTCILGNIFFLNINAIIEVIQPTINKVEAVYKSGSKLPILITSFPFYSNNIIKERLSR